MRTFLRDLRFGLRIARANPGTSAVIVLTLAVGITASTTVFSWIDTTLLRPYAGAADPSRLAALETHIRRAPTGGHMISFVDYRDYRDRMRSISGLAVHRQTAFSLTSGERAEVVWGELASGNYFDVLGVRPILGRTFSPAESTDAPGSAPVVVIGERLWRNRFRSDPAIVGKVLEINRRQFTVVGVVPESFHGTVPGMFFQMWVPATMGAETGIVGISAITQRHDRSFLALARLRDGVSRQQANAEAETFSASLAATYPRTNRNVQAEMVPSWREHSGPPDLLLQPLRILMSFAALLLVIVSANVAHLLLARSVSRRRELGIRAALGANRARAMMQAFTETLVLAVSAALLAFPLNLWATSALPALIPNVGLPIVLDYSYSVRTFYVAAFACGLCALLSGVAPALFSARADINDALKQGGRTGMSGAGSRRARAALVVAEMALATTVLVGAGLFIRTFRNLQSVDPGFDVSRVMFGRMFVEGANRSAAELKLMCARMADTMRASTPFTASAYSDFTPLSSTAGPWLDFSVDGYVPQPGEAMTVNRAMVSPGYFEAMRTPILQGREFRADDDEKAPPVAIVTEAFARRYLDGRSPVGRTMRVGKYTLTIVGLARDGRFFSRAEAPRAFAYFPFQQFYTGTQEVYFFGRYAGSMDDAARGMRGAAAQAAPGIGLHTVALSEYTQVSSLPERMSASLVGALGGVSLFVAAIGLFSVISYAVTQRTQEIGIRLAMGARRSDVIGMVVREGARLALYGVVTGVLGAAFVARLIRGMLFGVGAADATTYVATAGFIALVAVIATGLPAMRASRIDPASALRM